MTIGATSKSRSRSLRFNVSPPPLGTIVVFDGGVEDIPDGWALADGNNGTVNLVDYYVQGTTSDDEIGNIEGTNTNELSEAPSHSHSSAEMTSDDWVSHSHAVTATTSDSYPGLRSSGENDLPDVVNSTSGSDEIYDVSASHDHSFPDETESSGSGGENDNRPASRKLYYIQRIEA